MAEEPRVRRNIDRLSADELSNYQHAITKLKEISQHNPDSIDGYTYFRLLHDSTTKGPCEHKNDTFLPWHRAHLYLWEEALRRSDPPRTMNVTQPYWDWSALPSGNRYPRAFEDPDSVLFHLRNDTAICRQQNGDNCERLPYPRELLESTRLNMPKWSAPIGDDPLLSFGGVAGGESDCRSPLGPGYGALEQPVHNNMHGSYVGGDMGNSSTAARDPIFWAFHTYIDLLWYQWQQVQGHEVNTDLEARLCGLFKDREHTNRFQVKNVLDPTKLGYTYDYAPGEPPPSITRTDKERFFVSHPAVDFVLSGRKSPEAVRTLEVTIPNKGFKEARLIFTGVKASQPFSYEADIYLTPPDEEFQPKDVEFRERYLVDLLYMWQAHHHAVASDLDRGRHEHEAHTLNVAVDLGRTLDSLADAHAGETWRVWVALTASIDAPSARDTHAERFGAAAAEAPGGTIADHMDFRDLMLRVD
jgi:Common central domain of tyrosinase